MIITSLALCVENTTPIFYDFIFARLTALMARMAATAFCSGDRGICLDRIADNK